MKKLTVDAPINPLSMGQIAFGVCHELLNQGIDLNLVPKMGNYQLDAFDKNCDEFKNKLNQIVNGHLVNFDHNAPCLSIWHLQGSQYKLSNKYNSLLTFHELDRIEVAEKNILNSFNSVFVTNEGSKRVFEEGGVTVPIHVIKLGIDETQTYNLNKTYFDDGSCVFTIMGKFENRKHTKKAIQGWCKKFGNNNLYRLHLFVTNPFFKPEQMNAIFADTFGGQAPPYNVKIFPYQPLNSQINDALNATDVILDLSGGEALSLPSLNAVALGKHALIHNCTAMKDWANSENSVLIEPNGMMPAADGVFFHNGQSFNQGNFFVWNEEDYLNGLEAVYNRWKSNKMNEEGQKLRDIYSFKNGVSKIIEVIYG
jgi:hypothetical protein